MDDASDPSSELVPEDSDERRKRLSTFRKRRQRSKDTDKRTVTTYRKTERISETA